MIPLKARMNESIRPKIVLSTLNLLLLNRFIGDFITYSFLKSISIITTRYCFISSLRKLNNKSTQLPQYVAQPFALSGKKYIAAVNNCNISSLSGIIHYQGVWRNRLLSFSFFCTYIFIYFCPKCTIIVRPTTLFP